MTAKILVVEDEAVIAQDIRATLRGYGYVVPMPVASGAAALDATASHAPDLVLMDICIQGAIDGIETAAKIRDEHGTPVVYLTSYSDEATLARAKATGAYGYVLKPFTDRDLRTAVEVALQKRKFEERLAERERWFATTLKSIGDAVIATDTKQRITFMNVVAERVTGWTSEDARGRPLAEVMRLMESMSGAAIESPLTVVLQEGFAVELPRSAKLKMRSGAEVEVDDSAAPIVDDRGGVVGGVVVFRDVTERRKLEARLAQTERLAAIGTLSAGMAHEINNPLACILANVTFTVDVLSEIDEKLRSSSHVDVETLRGRLSELAQALADAKEGGIRVHRIIHDLKDFGRADVVDTTVLELSDVMEGAIRMTSNLLRHHAQVRREYRTTPFVEANEGRLGQVFINLLVNAAQAMGEGAVDSKAICVGTFTDDRGRAVAEVRDNGSGIPLELQKRIFDPFFTTKAVGQGAGLGLSICHSIIQSLGGEIIVKSAVGAGATFQVALPPAKPSERRTKVAVEQTPTRRGRVLVIDDDASVGRAIGRLLQRAHDVFLTHDAREALPRITTGESFDVILCDVMMPGMTGVEFFETLRDNHPEMARRVVFVTGGTFARHTDEFLRSTGNVILPKPAEPGALLRLVAEYVEGAALAVCP